MKASKLQSFSRVAGAISRRQPRLCDHDFPKLIPSERCLKATATRPFSSVGLRPARLFTDRGNEDQEVETAQRQLDQLQLDQEFTAAPPINFDAEPDGDKPKSSEEARQNILRRLRVVPQSPAYFSARPNFTDDYVHLHALLRRYAHLPTVKPAEARRIAFTDYETYAQSVGESIRPSRYNRMIEVLKRINLIHPKLMPAEVRRALDKWAKDIQPYSNKAAPIEIDEYGRAGAVGRRKASSAKAWVVEGEGEVLVNGRPLHQAFSRVHDRESVIWALKVTQRVDRYNVFAMAHGGGTTGQAEALTLAISKALMAHEPSLKPLLRKAGCVARDPRRVERKKPGKRKARKMPAWVKR